MKLITEFKDWYKKLNKEGKNKVIDEITRLVVDIYIKNKCQKCERELPNKSFFTKEGCKWCSAKYHFKELKDKK